MCHIAISIPISEIAEEYEMEKEKEQEEAEAESKKPAVA